MAKAPKEIINSVPSSEPARYWCLWCGMQVFTDDDEHRHREECPAARGEAPTPAEYIGAIRAGRRPPLYRGDRRDHGPLVGPQEW